MPGSVFVDTGYILALVNENDQHHSEALGLSERFDGEPVVVTDAVLLEIGNALSRMDRDAAVPIIQDLRESPGVTVVNLTPELFESAFGSVDRLERAWLRDERCRVGTRAHAAPAVE